MKKIFIVLIIILFLTDIGISQSNIPSVQLKKLDGKPFNTSQIKNDNKPVILSFWATWCKPCVKELTTIADVYQDWQDETGVKLIAVSIDNSRSVAQVKPMVNGKNWDYQVLLDVNNELKRAMNVNAVPHTFLVNGKGEVVWQHTSFSEGAELELIGLVKDLVKSEEAAK